MTNPVENVDPEINVGERVLRQMGMTVEQVSGPSWLAIADKITSDHISTVLDHVGKSQEIDLEKSKWARWERFVYVLIGTGILVCLTIFIFPKDQEVYMQILEWAGIFFAGGVGGYGIGVRKNNRTRSFDD